MNELGGATGGAEVLRPGTKVLLDSGLSWEPIEALVTAARIDFHGVSYECEWWNGGELSSETFVHSRVVSVDQMPPLKIGFQSQ